eukprot:1887230-Rhodomonas_salina.1
MSLSVFLLLALLIFSSSSHCSFSSSFSSSSPHLTIFSLPRVLPVRIPQVYFSKEWASRLVVSVHNLLTTVFHHVSSPPSLRTPYALSGTNRCPTSLHPPCAMCGTEVGCGVARSKWSWWTALQFEQIKVVLKLV